jgi:hypothetical protein
VTEIYGKKKKEDKDVEINGDYKMLIKMSCSSQEVTDYVRYYEEQGLEFVNKFVHSKEQVELTFRTSGKELATSLAQEDAQLFLEFEDGTQSPLYVRKQRDFSE